MDYTDAEKAEMAAHPIGTITGALPPDRFALRVAVAKKLYEKMKTLDWWRERPPAVREVFEKYPPWKFYTNTGGTLVRRMFGVGERNDGGYVLRMVTAHLAFVNNVIGGVPAEETVPTESWDDNQKFIIENCGTPQIFFDPCGWILIQDE